LEISKQPKHFSPFPRGNFLLEFPGRVYNSKIFSSGYGNEIWEIPKNVYKLNNKMFGNSRGPKQNVTLFQGAFFSSPLGISREGIQF
jgi:hypothetical protein